MLSLDFGKWIFFNKLRNGGNVSQTTHVHAHTHTRKVRMEEKTISGSICAETAAELETPYT